MTVKFTFIGNDIFELIHTRHGAFLENICEDLPIIIKTLQQQTIEKIVKITIEVIE